MSGIPSEKILTPAAVDLWQEQARAAGHSIGFTCGAFDVMHAGHAQYLAEARRLCDRLLVAVNSDASIRRYKSVLRPVNVWEHRAYVVASMGAVDCVTVLEEDRPLSLLLRWKPDLYIKGGDYQSGSLRSGSAVAEYGGKTIVIAPQFATSTTAMFDRIQALAIHAEPESAPRRDYRGLVLLDRDGTLVRDVPFDPTQVELLPGVGEALRKLQHAGFMLCLITNQQGLGLGYFGMPEFIEGNRKLLRLLAAESVSIAKIYFCPHSAAAGCNCRKPAPGMISQAMREHNFQANDCYVIGDSRADVEAAQAAGCIGFYVGLEQPGLERIDIGTAAASILRNANTQL